MHFTRHEESIMLGGSSAMNPTTRTRHARGLSRRELSDSLLRGDYFHRVEYFWLNTAWLYFFGCIRFVDSVRRTTYSHVGFAAPDKKKTKCSSFKSQLSFTFATPKIPGGCVITYLPQIYSVTW
jgi:hypothetical protein